jgi:hypothetical protein
MLVPVPMGGRGVADNTVRVGLGFVLGFGFGLSCLVFVGLENREQTRGREQTQKYPLRSATGPLV